jgi:uncharacterized protein
MNRVKVLFLLALLPVSLAFAQRAPAPTPPGGVSVTATGTAYGEPDEVSFDAGVSALNADVQVATARVNGRVSSLLDALRAAGVADEDIRTSSFTIYPEPAYGPNGVIREMRYRVANTLHVTVRDTAQLGALLGSSIEAGANEVSNVVYTFADRSALERQAREEAMANAREKAEQLAQFGGAELGEVRRIIEGGNRADPFADDIVALASGADMESARFDVPVSSGQLAVTVAVRVTFGLEEAR